MSPEVLARIDAEWREAVAFYRARAPVIFFSSERFWEPHGFVQQSLARALVSEGVPVRWLDGSGWRRYLPVVDDPSPLLRVSQLPALPGRRFMLFDRLNVHWQWRVLRRMFRREPRAMFWVQGGIDERLAQALPAADVYSVFDDPYSHSLDGALCRKAHLILCQNSHATRLFQSDHPDKTYLAYPPMELGNVTYDDGVFEPPAGFPKKMMGYIGSFFGAGFDFPLLEHFLRTLPDWGFVLMGRSDDAGDRFCEELHSRYKNFLRLPWAHRRQTALLWRRLSATLLLYPRFAQQDGAFATKAVESLRFGVPCVGTSVPKTADLLPVVCATDRDELVALAVRTAGCDREAVKREGERLAAEMDPRHYLARVARLLRGRVTA